MKVIDGEQLLKIQTILNLQSKFIARFADGQN